MPSAGYNPQQAMVCYRWLFWFLLPLGLLFPARAATSWEDPAARLAGQISAITGPGPARLILKNRSSIPTDQLPVIRRLLEHDLSSNGVTVSSSAVAPTVIRVTLSENAKHGLWIAEVQEGTEVNVAMVSTDTEAAAAAAPEASVTPHKTLLLSQETPILDVDFVALGGERRMLVLEPGRLVLYRMNGGTWAKDQSYDIPHARPLPRDPRGRIVIGTVPGHLFDAYLPGILCSGSDNHGQIDFSCADSEEAWPFGAEKALYNPTRNYFTGVLAPGARAAMSPFYSAAEYSRSGGTVAVFSQVSGQVVVNDKGILKTVIGTRDWGSDIASVDSPCGLGSLLLVSAAGATANDSIRAYELPGKEAIPVSTALSLEGTVTAMWTANEGATATVVIRKQQPLLYEAYHVSFLCN